MPNPVESINVLGTLISAVNMDSAINIISSWIEQSNTNHYVCVSGVHGVMESLRNPEIKKIHNSADMCVPDGMPMTWIGWLYGKKTMNRVYGPELMQKLLEKASLKGWRNFFYGGKPGVAEELAKKMQQKFPGLIITGTYSPPFRPLTVTEENEITARINAHPPDILWLGISTPKQEKQMWEFKNKLKTKVMIGVGAAFDFLTGRLRLPPAWIQKIGMEWLFRMLMEPHRLAPRYLRNNPLFLWHILLQLGGLRKYPYTDEHTSENH